MTPPASIPSFHWCYVTATLSDQYLIRPLVSYHYLQSGRGRYGTTLAEWFQKNYDGGRPDLFLDSGAYSVSQNMAPVNIDRYIAWLHDNAHESTVYAGLDVIGDHVKPAENQRIMEAAGLTPLPCFHVGEPWPVLEAMLERYDYVALGGMVPHARDANLGPWIARAFDYSARSRHRGNPVYHGFGMTNSRYAMRHHFRSIDSSKPSSCVRFGHIILWSERQAKWQAVCYHKPRTWARHVPAIRAHGLDPAWFTDAASATRGRRVIASGAAVMAFETALMQRHATGDRHAGTRVYLADSHWANFRWYEEGARLWRAVQS